MLVDDEEGIRKVLGISLADAGYRVLTAATGEAAMALFREEYPSIVLTDIKMPGMGGIELLRKIKQERPETEVIMISGHGDMELAVKSLKFEATDFITKPINDDVLEIALSRARERILMRQKLREYTENLEALVEEKSARLVEAERLAAVGQTVEGLSSAIWNMAGNPDGEIRALDEMPCYVSIHNRDLRVLATNALYRQRLGDKVGKNSWDIYREDSTPGRDCPAARTFDSGKGQRVREIITYAGGAQVPAIVHTSPIRNRAGEVELVLEVATDVSELGRLQEELTLTQQRYRQLFDEAPCYISVQDRKLRLVTANRQFQEDFDHEMGLHCFEVYKNRQEPCPDCPVVKTFEDGQTHQTEMVVTSRSGKKNQLLVRTAPIRNAAGQIPLVMELSTNITETRQLQDQLSSLGLLIGSISHGIKGLLTGLDGGMFLLDTGFAHENREQMREGHETVRLMVSRIRNMVLDILHYARDRDLKWEKMDALGIAADVAGSFEPKIRSRDVELVCEFDPAAADFDLDAGIVRAPLITILENALDACLADTSGRAHRIFFGVRPEKGKICFDIRDNGTGMDEETRENLFKTPFASRGENRTGLGLFLSNRIIQIHGGEICVSSSPGKGAHFSMRIPVSPS